MPSAPSSADGPPSATLSIRGIALSVALGCLPGEKDRPQAVEMDVTIRFAHAPEAVRSDALADTVDYGALVERIRETVAGREFDLVEHLAGQVFDALRSMIPAEDALELSVRKVAPPVPEITGGASFTLSG
jgi:dihydroneopterin aldolase